MVEQLFRKQQVLGSNPSVGSTFSRVKVSTTVGIGRLWTPPDPCADPRGNQLAAMSAGLTGVRRGAESDRVLATVLLTDIVGSSERAAELGDRRWRDLLEAQHALVRGELARWRGREVDTAGDGFLATFDGPARAIRCACAIRDGLHALGVEIRAGLHTGECEIIGGKVGGIAVHTGARVAASARPGEILVSGTVRDLIVGSGIELEDRGVHSLKGIPGEWQLLAVTRL